MPLPGRSRSRSALVALTLLAAVATAVPARAGTLVLRRGGWIRTRGPWLRLGDRIRFRSMAGELRTLALDEVDLEASRDGRQRQQGPGVAGYVGGRWHAVPAPRRPRPVCRLESDGRGQPPRLTCDPPPGSPETSPPDPGRDGPHPRRDSGDDGT
jgi:hypothetical protein